MSKLGIQRVTLHPSHHRTGSADALVPSGRPGSLLGALVSRVAPPPPKKQRKGQFVPRLKLAGAPQHVQDAAQVVEDFIDGLPREGTQRP